MRVDHGTRHGMVRYWLLDRLCRNRYGSPWRIQFGEEEPQLLVDWLGTISRKPPKS